MKQGKLTSKDVGRWGTVLFDDTGRADGIIVDVDKDYIKFFSLADSSLGTVDHSQIVEVRGHLMASQEA